MPRPSEQFARGTCLLRPAPSQIVWKALDEFAADGKLKVRYLTRGSVNVLANFKESATILCHSNDQQSLCALS